MFDKILIVCIGNICRSPTAERLLQSLLPEKIVSSAGIGAMKGHEANPQAAVTAKHHQLTLDGHKARQLTNELCHENDLILVMEQEHLAGVYQISPESRGKTMLLGRWLDNAEIEDPYNRSDEMFEHLYQLLEKACLAWQNNL